MLLYWVLNCYFSGDFDLSCIYGMSCKIGKFGVAYIKLYVGPISPFEEQDQTEI